ncbi:MAG: tRNA (cytidine(34)-2'-O)-methyltransferase [Planctomycetaceae bacterium]|nr:tRNA (cytidine(34)-2'-O)-methyltransferase [Planctomycetaceae bacterium]
MSRRPLLHVVLYQPDIPQNTGNIGRTCVAVGAKLWLIRPLGFQLDERHLLRAGMDYWEHLDYEVVDTWAEFRTKQPTGTVWCVENPATRLLWDATFTPGDVLSFGSETRGLPAALLDEFRNTTVQLPMRPEVRSLNLASTVNTAVYEAVRQFGGMIGE